MTSYRYAVKVKPSRSGMLTVWRCEVCGESDSWVHLNTASSDAQIHAAGCEELHRANWEAMCASCKPFGKVAKACPECLGRGWVE